MFRGCLVMTQIWTMVSLMNWDAVHSSSSLLVIPVTFPSGPTPDGHRDILSTIRVGQFCRTCSWSWTPIPRRQPPVGEMFGWCTWESRQQCPVLSLKMMDCCYLFRLLRLLSSLEMFRWCFSVWWSLLFMRSKQPWTGGQTDSDTPPPPPHHPKKPTQ